MDKWLESEEFYNLCQAYRHVPITDQQAATQAFEDLKNQIREKHREPFVKLSMALGNPAMCIEKEATMEEALMDLVHRKLSYCQRHHIEAGD